MIMMGPAWAVTLAACIGSASALIRVVCVGDSNTVGKRAATGNDYPSVLSRLLGENYEVFNAGLSGSTVSEDTDRVYEEEEEYEDAVELVKRATGDVVVAAIFGTNDAKLEFWDDVEGDFVDTYVKFVEGFLELGATVVLGVPVPYLGDAGPLCDGEGEDHGYCQDWGSITECPINNEIPRRLGSVAERAGVPLFDVQATFVKSFHAESVDDYAAFEPFYADRVHPLDEGLALVAEAASHAIFALDLGYAPTYVPTYEPTRSRAPSAGVDPSAAPTITPTYLTPAPVPLSTIYEDGCPVLRALAPAECPRSEAGLDIWNCATVGLVVGDLCEGDGECGTDKGLDNCDSSDMSFSGAFDE